MLECLLVVAMSYNGVVISQNFRTISEVPTASHARIMAFEAGRSRATIGALDPRSDHADRKYGYDCGEGWVSRGLSHDEAFNG